MSFGKATRREFMKTAGLGLAAGVAASRLEKPAQAAPKRPNFVWLLSEDNSTHYMKLFDEKGAETPRIAELAEGGVIFTHAFSNCPVCSAARSTLETGCYGARIGTQFHRKFKTVPLPEGLRMFPAYLKQAGYYTSNKKKT
ncbi:MAG: sulfatase-like hydrolase/transferase, partial [Planctomycetota bacterium]